MVNACNRVDSVTRKAIAAAATNAISACWYATAFVPQRLCNSKCTMLGAIGVANVCVRVCVFVCVYVCMYWGIYGA